MGNTKRGGELTLFSFREGKKYIAVCLELDIVKEGTDLLELNKEMLESVVGYVATVCKAKLGDEALNRPAAKKYWDKYRQLHATMEKPRRIVRRKSASFGSIHVLPIATLCAA